MKKDADRQAKRRTAMRDQGRPETHAVDRAVAEAVAYLAVQNRRDCEKKGESLLKFRDIVDVASRILSHRGRFDNFASIRAVASRLRRRKEHLWTLPAPQRQKASDSATRTAIADAVAPVPVVCSHVGRSPRSTLQGAFEK